MPVDETGQDDLIGRLDHLVAHVHGEALIGPHLSDETVLKPDAPTGLETVLQEHRSAMDDSRCFHLNTPFPAVLPLRPSIY